MECKIKMNGLEQNVCLNDDYPGWEDRLKAKISDCVRNGHIHNTIEDCEGNVVFSQSDFWKVKAAVEDRHKTYVLYTENEKWLGLNKLADGKEAEGYYKYDDKAIAEEMDLIYKDEVERVFRRICAEGRSEASQVLTVRSDGRTSLKVVITDLARSIGAEYGDQVMVTIEKVAPRGKNGLEREYCINVRGDGPIEVELTDKDGFWSRARFDTVEDARKYVADADFEISDWSIFYAKDGVIIDRMHP